MTEALQFSDVSTPIGTFRICYLGDTVRVVDLLEKGVNQTGVPAGAVRRKPPYPAGSLPGNFGITSRATGRTSTSRSNRIRPPSSIARSGSSYARFPAGRP